TLLPISPRAVSNSISGRSSAPRPVARRRRSTERWRTSSPSSKLDNDARNSKRLLPTGLEASEGFLDCGVVGEDPVQGRELEDDPYLLVGAARRSSPSLPLICFKAAITEPRPVESTKLTPSMSIT